jgi:hypothetical protein
MRLLVFLPLLLPISISGCLPLYHALREVQLETGTSGPGLERLAGLEEGAGKSESEQRISAGHTARVRSVHFCGVCAFTKGMKGALLVASRQLQLPSLSSSALALVTESAPRWNTLHPVSRAPPTVAHA